MGCTTSKQARLDRRQLPSPLARSHSFPHDSRKPISSSGTQGHVVALTSSTIGTLKLDNDSMGADQEDEKKRLDDDDDGELSAMNEEGKLWSKKMSKKVLRTPTETPPNEPEPINAAELMAGLEEPATPPARFSVIVDRHSFSFYPIQESEKMLGDSRSFCPTLTIRHESTHTTIWSTPMWKPGAAKMSEHLDPEILSAFRRAMEEHSPQHPSLILRSPESSRTVSPSNIKGILDFDKASRAKKWHQPGGEGNVVLYFTSLGAVRKTYDDCFLVRVILKGYGIWVEEKDVSMDRGFRDELSEMMGAKQWSSGELLPSVFANGGYVGGVEEIRRLHDEGELMKLLGDCENTITAGMCEGCGDVRFVLCGRCSGSRKVYMEEEEEEEEEEEWEDVGGGFRRCTECNENGIVRCHVCCLSDLIM